ncbi:mannan endo-1,4-beta-mannosidase 5-like [Aristolochia californica]|uniref:mannan endo-1,4-beta-mannosidase 5-like n=1 Tax=Aristolochia californica TaxID=171875 RepID=UPI0035DAEC58
MAELCCRVVRATVAFVVLLAVTCEASRFPHKHGRGFIRTWDSEFVLHGSPFFFNGFNSYWMMRVATDPTQRYKVSDVFREAAAVGLTVCRTWAFSDGGDRALQISPGVYDERVFQALDFVISEAGKYKIRLILSLVNNFNDYGGRPQYVEWARNAGAPINSDDDFYTNPVVKGYYKNHVKRALTRVNTMTKTTYRDDPTIMAWELINEPRCQSDYSGNTVHGWVEEMASYAKALDYRHLLEIGMEGFYGDTMPEKKQNNPGYQVGTDFIKSNLLKEVDFATVHAYPDIWLSGQSDGSQVEFVQRWMASHWTDARAILKKPLVLAEFGKSKKDPGYSISQRDEYLSRVYRDIYTLARHGGSIGGGLVWQLMAQGMDSYYDGYEIVLPQNPSTTSLITGQSHLMSALAHTLARPHHHTTLSESHSGHYHAHRKPGGKHVHRSGRPSGFHD